MSELDELLDPGMKERNSGSNGPQKSIPNAIAVLVLGIISLVGCIFYGVPGLICGIIALSMMKKVKQTYNTDKASYDTSYKNASAGYVCAIIGTSLSALFMLFMFFALFVASSGGGRF